MLTRIKRSRIISRCLQRRKFTTSGAIRHQEVRTRFAPSPTGMMHIGGLRTALFNYLFAKKHNGSFILRIEDTDKPRTVAGAEENIINMLNWAGIPYDEGPGKDSRGFGPYRQSERTHIYQKYVDQLLENGHAYRCFCTPERLERLRETFRNKGIPSLYDRFCLKLTPQQIREKLEQQVPYTVRLKVPPGTTEVEDALAGKISFNNNFVDDQVLLKSDKFPTYHLANVVDDHLMQISHVIRGNEWLTSTPKHMILYKAFGWTPPTFVHLPLLLNEEKQKLSKRHGDTSVLYYKREGYTPEGLINFVALLGWNPGENDYTEIFTLDQLVDKFSLEHLSKSPAVVSHKKLNWINMEHMRILAQNDAAKLTKYFMPFLQDRIEMLNNTTKITADEAYIHRVLRVACQQDRFDVLPQIVDKTFVLLTEPAYNSVEAMQYFDAIKKPQTGSIINLARECLSALKQTQISKDEASNLIKNIAEKAVKTMNVKKSDVFQTLRYCLTAKREGFELPILIELLGVNETIRRLDLVTERIQQSC